VPIRLDMVSLHLEAGNFDEATKELDAARAVDRRARLSCEAHRPEVLDTYGWMLVETGNAARGVELMQAAVKAAPGIPIYRLHLAQGWLNAGDKDRARDELEQLL
jgi:predicted Zn-dependent protease